MPFSIRRYRPSDREAVWSLHVAALEAVGARAKDPVAHNLDSDLDDMEGAYLNNGGEFLVGSLGDAVVAMGALKRMSAEAAEITRMRVHPQHWRCGYGEAILHRLESAASEHGYTELWLDTVPLMNAAEKLYRKHGFQEFLRVRLPGYEASESILFRKRI